jgi:hypothetical protein
MWRFIAMALLAASVTAAMPREGFAQNRFGRYRPRPTTSPYLSLLQNGFRGSAAFQYYRRILPEQEFRRNEWRQSQSLDELRRRVDRQENELIQRRMGTTGHATSFLNLGGYFGGSRSSTYGRR